MARSLDKEKVKRFYESFTGGRKDDKKKKKDDEDEGMSWEKLKEMMKSKSGSRIGDSIKRRRKGK